MPRHDKALAMRPIGVATTTEQCLTESHLGRIVTEAVSPSTAEVTKASVAGQAHCAVGLRSENVQHIAVLGPRCHPLMVDVISIVGRGYQPTHLVPPYSRLPSPRRRGGYWVIAECLREHERACTARANTAATTSSNSVHRKTTKLSDRQSVHGSGSQTNRFLNGACVTIFTARYDGCPHPTVTDQAKDLKPPGKQGGGRMIIRDQHARKT